MKKLFLLFVAVLAMGICAVAQNRTIHGTVIDANTNEPLVGASVVPAGTTMGTTTDIDGHFTLVIGPNVHEVTVSYIGYTSRTLAVKDNMVVSLTPSAEMLNTVVVTGYGSGKKLGSIAGSVAVVGQAALENVTTPSFLDALQGKVSGLSVLSSSGDPSAQQTNIRLRGVNSLYSSTEPLFILDGAPITSTMFNTINPNDIENITVLKDAASVAIYGSRAANGVIVITSKKGKYAEKANVSIRAKIGWSAMVSDQVDMMNSEQYIKFRDMIGQPVSDDARAAWEVYGIDTDWRSETFDSHAPTYSLEGAVSGGTESLSYYISLNYLSQEGIIAQSGMQRETLRVNLSSKVNKWFRVGTQLNFGYTRYQTNNESNANYSGDGIYTSNPMVFSRNALPYDSPRYYTIGEDGKLVWGDKAAWLHYSSLLAPWWIDQDYRTIWRNRATLNGNLWEEITPIKGLTIRAQQSLDAYDYRLKSNYHPIHYLETPMGDTYLESSADPITGIVPGSNQQGFTRYYCWTYTNTAEYRFKLADVHNISVLVGEESIYGKSEAFSVYTSGQMDNRLELLYQGTDVKMANIGQSIAEKSLNSIFASASYNFNERYFLDANYRRDGSSYFAPGHRWANFWSIAGMWDAKQEKFLQDVTWLDAARIHLSYGTTGNSEFDNYAYYGLLGSGSLYNGSSSLGFTQAANPDLSWEKVSGVDLGVNLGLFQQLNIEAAFYDKTTNDMIVYVPYSLTTGVSGNFNNMATMKNTGVDVDINWTPINTKDWFFEFRANFNYNYNRITKLFDGLDELTLSSTGTCLMKDHKAWEFKLVRYAGVDPRDGKQMWYDKDGNLTKQYNEERDAVPLGKSMYAPYSGGWGFTLGWKGISLRTDWSWAAKKYLLNNDAYFYQNANFGAQDENQCVEMLNVWTTPGQVTDIPALGETIQFDTHLLENASFMRLKNLTVSYSFPKAWLSKIELSDLRLHFTGRNLWTITGFRGYDPEPESNLVQYYYPNTKQFEFGIDVTF